MMEETEEADSEIAGTGVDIKEMLELQLTEIEMLGSMFPNPGEFQLDDPSAIASIRAYLKDSLKYEYLYSRLGFTVRIDRDSPKVHLELVCNLPHEYPAVPPVVFTRSPNMSRTGHSRLNEELSDFILGLDRGEICLYSVIDWLQENLDKFCCADPDTAASGKQQVEEEDTILTRLWIYSHHIYSKFKRRDIIDWANELKLTGFSLPGKPGVICLEGYSRPVDEFWHRIRRLNWKRLVIKEKDEFDIGNDDIQKHRKFREFEEKAFDARGGKGREYHMDLGQFYDFLEKHGCGHIFSMYFGVEGKSSAHSHVS